ncbi:MAG TPA: CoA ester lyase [Spongiibacteraceae bacterium]|nr:CoA ester lyase [Spongiibacteraceae bacterium]
MQIRPRRSALYMPGSNQRALEKAKTLTADSLILDLEDAVAPAQKVLAREYVVAAINGGGYGKRELVIRINALDTEWGEDDLKAVAWSQAHAVCLPKIESATQIRAVADALENLRAPADMAIWAMLETSLGILHAQSIAGAHPRIKVLVMGTTDLAKDLRVPHTPDRLGLLMSLSTGVLAARAHGLDVLDGVHLDLNGGADFRAICEHGRKLGFDGKTLIHPNQVADANAVFGPSAEAIDHAQRILAIWEEAQRAGMGVTLLDGKLIENVHVEEAQRVLAIAKAIAELAE